MNLGKMPALEIPSLPGWAIPGVDFGGKERDPPIPSLGMRFSPLRLFHRLRRHRPPLLNSYPSFKTHPQFASQNQLLFSPPLLSTAAPGPSATLWVGNRPPPLSSTLAPAPCRWTTDSVRTESKRRAFLLPLELPVKDPVHGSCSMRLN